jgi:hypothetical protein
MYRKLITAAAVLALTINLVAPAMADSFSSRINLAVSQKASAKSVVVKKHPGHSISRKAKFETTARSLARVNASKRTGSRLARVKGGEGRDDIVVGFAPLKPAEFVIISTKKVGKAVGRTSVRVGKTLVRGGKAVGRGVGRTGKLVVNTTVNQVKHTVGCALHPLGNCIVRTKNDTVRIGKAIGRGGKTIGRGVFCGGKAVAKSTRKVAKGVKRGAKKVGRGAKKVAKKLKLW